MRRINNFFEIKFLDFINKNYKEQKEIIDIGANIGNHSLFFLKFLNCKKVHSFEPFLDNLKLLEKNTSSFGEKSIIYKIALSNKDGEMPLYNSQRGNNGGFSQEHYNPNTYDKPGTMLPNIRKRASPEKRPTIHSKSV
jgi:FkbM family methyltransferase